MSSPGRLRETMPLTAALIDDLRSVFGADEINSLIRRGMAGEPTFWARESGVEVGARLPETGTVIDATQMVIRVPEVKR